MLSRRAFAGCALCATTALLASDPEARSQTPPGFTRTVLRRMDFPGETMATIQVLVDITPGFLVARHTHPGVETGYVVEGGLVLQAAGDADRTLAVGDSFQMAREQPHAVQNGSARSRVLSVYVVDKDKPLASPAPT
jgi:quercetin dioxygenase-like cupin family protein